MAIGKRIRFFRNRKGMTQYETEARTPKHDLVKEMANIFDVSTHALTVPDIDTYIGLMHTLFALKDMYGLKIGEIDGEICLRLDKSPHRRSVICLWTNFKKSRKKKRKNRKRRKHKKDLADIQFPYLNPHYRAVVAAFVKQPCLTGELHKCNRPVCQSCFPHCSRKSARFSLCH